MSIPPRIGFIGLGIMGKAMAENLVKAGYNVTVYNRNRQKTVLFADRGCAVATTPRDLAKMCNIVITMVSDPAAMDDVLEGPHGVYAADFGTNTLINMSTISVAYAQKLKSECFRRGIKLVDCPVSGSKPLAENATLIMLAGGDKKTIEEVSPILLSMGKAIVYAGPAPAGTELKLCINLIVAGLTTALAESAALAETLQLDPKLIFSVLSESAALNCPYFKMKEANILGKKFPPAFPLKHMLKDLRFMLSEAAERGQTLPATEAMEKLMGKATAMGEGEQDLSVIFQTLGQPAYRKAGKTPATHK